MALTFLNPATVRDRVIDHVQTVQQSGLETYVGQLSIAKMRETCRALGIAIGCM
ncbi:MAG: hypothetical protein PF508_16870 [Spirochaeta sp.]|nr:hypothetical protein [Spirochaeta sp.]